MRLCRHQDGRICDSVAQLCHGIAGAWGNDQDIQIVFGTDGLRLRYRKDPFFAGDLLHFGYKILLLPEKIGVMS